MALPAKVRETIERARALRARAQIAREEARRVAEASRDMWERSQILINENREVRRRARPHTVDAGESITPEPRLE
jgi:hypothetical protein